MTGAAQTWRIGDGLTRVERAVAAIAAARPMVLRDGADGTGDVVFAAANATVGLLAFTVRHTSCGAGADRPRRRPRGPGTG